MQAPIHAQALAGHLRIALRQAKIDTEAFERPLKVCQLAHCRATCCHDGVVLDPLEHTLLEHAATQHTATFARYGLDLSAPLFRQDDAGKWRTTTRAAKAEELAPSFPAHFPRTRCAFLDQGHRCAWQLMALEEERHPWFYKPVSCWMHPVALHRSPTEGTPPTLTVAGHADEPEDFTTGTPCGRPTPEGQPARMTLRNELALLGNIAGRDFLAELGVTDANARENAS